MPLLINQTEWQELQAGLIQRAELLEAILADIYGPAKLVSEGRLPALACTPSVKTDRPSAGWYVVEGD